MAKFPVIPFGGDYPFTGEDDSSRIRLRPGNNDLLGATLPKLVERATLAGPGNQLMVDIVNTYFRTTHLEMSQMI